MMTDSTATFRDFQCSGDRRRINATHRKDRTGSSVRIVEYTEAQPCDAADANRDVVMGIIVGEGAREVDIGTDYQGNPPFWLGRRWGLAKDQIQDVPRRAQCIHLGKSPGLQYDEEKWNSVVLRSGISVE